MTYDELVTNIAQKWPNRTDITDMAPEFIALAEATFRRDRRFRKLQVVPFTISIDGQELPADLRAIESWEYDNGTYFGEIEVVPFGQLSALKARLGKTGVPQYVSVANGRAYFGPEPGGSLLTRLAYWREIAPLSPQQQTNWLLQEHPDVYLYGSLLQVEGFIKNDPRMATWEALFEKAAEQIHLDADEQTYGGVLHRAHRVIG